uniref:Uncharacterized protein n=1 Tax=viral metagenome TaxID=1070528 RepID=A0A6H1ZQI0_9ZZZZ
MNYRLSTIHARKTYGTDTTEIIDLDMKDPISQLIIELAVTNVTSESATAHAIASLAKIEIIDGSDVLFSLNGYEAEAVDIIHNKVMRSNWNMYLDGNDVQRFVGINFGRYLWDKMLAFDPTRFRNPQLKLTLDVGAGGIASVSNKLQVWAALFDEKAISPIGFLMHKEIKDYLMSSAAHEYTDLPRDYPYRKLFIRAQVAGTEPNSIIGNIKLSEDQEKRVICNHGAQDLLRTMAAMNPALVENIIFGGRVNGSYVFTTATERTQATFVTFGSVTGTNVFATYGSAGGRMAVDSGASENAIAIVRGWTPHGTYEIPFGDQMDIDDWYDVAKVGSLRADITAVSGIAATDYCQLFLQQLRRY